MNLWCRQPYEELQRGESNLRCRKQPYGTDQLKTGVRTEYVTDKVNELSRVLTATSTVNEKEEVTTYVYRDGLLTQSSEEEYLTFHYNNIGSTMLLTDKNGEV